MFKIPISLLLFIVLSYSNLYSIKGIEIKTTGTFIDARNRARVINAILKNPAYLVGDIQGLDKELVARKKELNKIIKALGPFGDKLLEQTRDKLRNIIKHQIFWVHEDYIYADALYNVLQAHPYFVKLILLAAEGIKSGMSSRLFLEHQTISKRELAEAFNAVAAWRSYPAADPFVYIDFRRYEQLKEIYQKNPVFNLMHHIRECIDCDISRKEVPQVRKFFEDKVVEAITKKFPDKNEQIVIADFATGNLFQTFINLNKIAALGYKNIRLNLIDVAYKPLIKKYAYELSKQAKSHNVINIEPEYFKFDTTLWNLSHGLHSKKGIISWKSFDSDDMRHCFLDLPSLIQYIIEPLIELTLFNNTFSCFSMWFNNTPVNLEVVIYGDAADYLEDCKNNNLLKSNVLTAVDYFTETQDIFEDLRKKCLKSRAKVLGLVHDQEDQPNGKYISHFYFTKGAQHKPLKHFSIDLNTTKLTPISALPNTTDYYIEDMRALFTNINKKQKKRNEHIYNFGELSNTINNMQILSEQKR